MNSKNEPTVVLPFYVHVPIIGTLVKGVFTGVLFSLMSFTIDNVIIALENPQTMTDRRKRDSGKPLLQSLEILSFLIILLEPYPFLNSKLNRILNTGL